MWELLVQKTTDIRAFLEPSSSNKKKNPMSRQLSISVRTDNREIKIHVYGIRQTANVSWEFLRIENKQIKTVQSDSYG